MTPLDASTNAGGSVTATGATWRVLAGSVVGTSHQTIGVPCQDAHRWRALSGGALLATVADGAGSARLAEKGSALAVDAVVEALSEAFERGRPDSDEKWRDLMVGAMCKARGALEVEASTRGVDLGELATTLLVALVMPELAVAAQIGDGAVILGDGTGAVNALTRPQQGEYANETTFLTSGSALPEVQLGIHRGSVVSLVVFTDGLQRLALRMPAGDPLKGFFLPLFRYVAEATDMDRARTELHNFLTSPRVTNQTDDDLTLLIATLLDATAA